MFRKAKVIYLVCLLVFGSSIGSFAADNNIDDATKARVHENYGKLPLSFIQNDGQKDNKVKFYERGSGHSTYFTTDGIYLELISDKKINAEAINTKDNKQIIPESKTTKSKNQVQRTAGGQNLKSETIKLTPIGANKNPKIIAEKEQKGRVNYFIGNDPKKWKTNIPTYEAVVYKDIYKGIDMKFYGNNRQMEYDIIVKPGADPLLVRLSYEGIEGLSVTKDGKMEIALKEGTVVQNKPYCYQEIEGKKVEVGGEFRVLRAEGKMQKATGEYGKERTHTEDGHKQRFVYNFHIASYDKSHPLIIDPVLTYSTYLGGSEIDSGNGIAVDTSGNAYVTGSTYSTDFPMVSAFDGSHNGIENVFVTKLDASGTRLTYSTYLGGGEMDSGSGIAVDTSGNAYVTGGTYSTDFPMVSAFDGSHNGGRDVFVTKLNASGTSLAYSTYLGGGSSDYGDGIAVDTSGNAYVIGSTQSTNFPTLKEYQGNQPGWDAFVTKLTSTGGLSYSTYLGGGSFDFGGGIAVDTSGNAYVTGNTESTNFPTVSAFDGSHNGGGRDVFVTKLNASGTNLAYSTYLGGGSSDFGHGIAVDTSGNAYVIGSTSSTDFPTVSAFDGSHNGSEDAFVTKLDASGTRLTYSTYLGGGVNDVGKGIAVDTSGNAYVIGSTGSTNFPTVSAFGGFMDVFVTKLDASGTSLAYSTFLGGSDMDSGNGIAVDTSGNAYVTGSTESTNFPMVSAFYGSLEGGNDAFVTKLFTQAGANPLPASGGEDKNLVGQLNPPKASDKYDAKSEAAKLRSLWLMKMKKGRLKMNSAIERRIESSIWCIEKLGIKTPEAVALVRAFDAAKKSPLSTKVEEAEKKVQQLSEKIARTEQGQRKIAASKQLASLVEQGYSRGHPTWEKARDAVQTAEDASKSTPLGHRMQKATLEAEDARMNANESKEMGKVMEALGKYDCAVGKRFSTASPEEQTKLRNDYESCYDSWEAYRKEQAVKTSSWIVDPNEADR